VNDTIAELAINRLTIIPFTTHSLFQAAPVRDNIRLRGSGRRLLVSFSVVVNYNTISRANVFLPVIFRRAYVGRKPDLYHVTRAGLRYAGVPAGCLRNRLLFLHADGCGS
jgi:hypothetical protein